MRGLILSGCWVIASKPSSVIQSWFYDPDVVDADNAPLLDLEYLRDVHDLVAIQQLAESDGDAAFWI
jgi:hypothetical protein